MCFKKKNDKNNEDSGVTEETPPGYFGVFFSKYLWLGLLFLSIALSLNKYFGQADYAIYLAIKLTESISIAVIVAAIFSYTLGTTEFVDKIRALLERIVISRHFLVNLGTQGKQQALEALLKPTDIEKETYINISRYYDQYIKESLDIKTKNVRSNYLIHGKAYYDEEESRVAVKAVYSYRLYPSEKGYIPIKLGFDEEDTLSTCTKVIINRPDGERKCLDSEEDIKFTVIDNAGSKDRLATIDVNDFARDYDHLDIEIHTTEYGEDHWFMMTFKALQPTDGFRFRIECTDGLEIRKHVVFDVGKNYHTDTLGTIELDIACHQWINEGVGVAVLISYPHKMEIGDKT